jgi:carbamoyltransferase
VPVDVLRQHAARFDPFRGHSETAWRCFPEPVSAALGLGSPLAGEAVLARCKEARAVQLFTEEALEGALRDLVVRYRPTRIYISGGVFLNCVAIGRLARALRGTELVVCPVKKDSGTAVGAGVLAQGPSALGARVRTLRLGTAISGTEPEWQSRGDTSVFASQREGAAALADDIVAGKIVALVDGAGELGPRALGARSILADPSSAELAKHLNKHVKSRYSFQPFAGAFLLEAFRARHRYESADEFMSFAVRVPGPGLEGIRHRDGSCRMQLVPAAEGSMLGALLMELASRDRAPVVLNTSLNPRGAPMPRTAREAQETCAALGIERIYTPIGRWTP